MRGHVKETKNILKAFDKECSELCYSDFIPEKVKEARETLRASMDEGPSKMERIKEKLMRSLRGAFDCDLYDLSKASYNEKGDRIKFV